MSNRNFIALIAIMAAVVGVFSIIYAEPLVWQMGSSTQSEFTKGSTLLVGLWLLIIRFVSLFILPLVFAYLSFWLIVGIWNRERVAYTAAVGLIIAVFVLPIDVLADKTHRGYRDYFGSQSRGLRIEVYAGCAQISEPVRYTDEEFSEHWKEDTEKYSFDEIDVDGVMLRQCAPGKIPDANEEVIKYQERFLNREFSVLNPNWVPNELVILQEEVAVVDTANWKTYQNKKYGFELSHPENWSMKEYFSPGLWLSLMSPQDVCLEAPDRCTNFSLLFTPSSREEKSVQINLETVVRTPGVEERNNVYIPIHGVCMTSVPFPELILTDRRIELVMFVIQDNFPEEMSMDEATKLCESGKMVSPLFEKILTTLRASH